MNSAVFRFYAELNDFIDKALRYRPFEFSFWGNPSVKDAIESLGVPHTEVDLIVVNSEVVDFGYRIKNHDYISVYPVFESIDISSLKGAKPLRTIKFITDVHLGKLTKYLRMLGFDTLYEKNFLDEQIIKLAAKEGRVILTRDKGILKNKRVEKGYFVRCSNPKEQVREVLKRFDLYSSIEPFKRCMACNGELTYVEKNVILDKIPPKTKKYFDKFTICKSCGKIYWKGSHYEKMVEFIEELKKSDQKNIN